MKHFLFTAASLLAMLALASAGILNVVNLTEEAPLELILSAEKSETPFSVERHLSSGPFKLKSGPATLRTASEKLPDLEVPDQDERRIAILFPTDDGAKWHLIPSDAKTNKWSFRVINLSGTAVTFIHSKRELTVDHGKEVGIDVKRKDDISIKLPEGEVGSYPYRDPCAVIALLSKAGEETIFTFVSDL